MIPESDTATEINLLIMDKLINVFFFMRSYFTIFTQGEDYCVLMEGKY